MIRSNAIAACMMLSERLQHYMGGVQREIELLSNSLKITSGHYKGLILTFYADNSCTVKCNRFSFCIDLGARRSADELIRALVHHNIIADEQN